jgi:tRNA pseudouridine38-40 synthase
MPRYAIKLAYDGSIFSGSQRQPNARTVEGEVARAARELGMLPDDGWLALGSRTDAGVSAIGNVGALDTAFDSEAIIVALNSQMEGVWAYGLAKVREGFNPRHARERWYRYLVPEGGLDLGRAGDVLPLFLGEHDFTHFSKVDDSADRSPQRKVHSVTLRRVDGFLALDVTGESFLWQMVRRMAGAVAMVGSGEANLSNIKEALAHPDSYKGPAFAPLPPEGLVLMDVMYDFEFELEPLPEKFQRASLQANVRHSFFSELERRLASV